MPHTMDLTEVRPVEQNAPWESLPAAQQPDWRTDTEFARIRHDLATAPPLVTESEVATAHRALETVASGSAMVLQVGDCAESLGDANRSDTARKVAVINALAGHLSARTALDVVRFGRMAGQYAKPRSNPVEMVDGVGIPPYRGDLINSIEPNAVARKHDPRRMLQAYQASAVVLDTLRSRWRHTHNPVLGGPWSSHEALVIDYEGPLVRVDPATGHRYLGSTHFPWVGDRTRQLDHAQVGLLASVRNPVGCKIGPTADPQSVVDLCAVLDPERVPGRLTLITRMGRASIADVLPAIADAVRRAGHPVVWVCDPMHGNTVRTSSGRKTRHLTDLILEAKAFRRILQEHRLHPGGLHLEVAATDVTECVGGQVADEEALSHRYESLCDPRLNPDQALGLIDAVF